jgi:hypothetical protein
MEIVLGRLEKHPVFIISKNYITEVRSKMYGEAPAFPKGQGR